MFTENQLYQLNCFAPMFSFVRTWDFQQFLHLPHGTVAAFTGNQRGKTAQYAISYVLRILGWHPIPYRNVLYFECPDWKNHDFVNYTFDEDNILPIYSKGQFNVLTRPEDNLCPECGKQIAIHKRKTRTFRFCSETLPGDPAGGSGGTFSAETRNTVYPEFKKWLPSFLIKRDISGKRFNMLIHDPYQLRDFGGLKNTAGDIVVEFVSYSQATQAQAGVQRLSVWEDEEPPWEFHEEQLPRLLAEDGDVMLSLTPANKMSWTFDEIFERAKIYVRTPAVCAFLKKREGKDVKQIQTTDSKGDMAVIQAATDDNPTLSMDVIEKKYTYEDEDTMATRRYGIHTQSTGRVFNEMDMRTHFIKRARYFPGGINLEWTHGRIIDYHERNPWAVIWIDLSDTDEAFVSEEWSPDPNKWITKTIAQEMVLRSLKAKYHLNLIDPLAKKMQVNTGISAVDELNKVFADLRRQGDGTGGFWESFDTKGLRGRDEIRKRLKNAVLCGKPFNNVVIRDGVKTTLPTLWILQNCQQTAKSLKMWRYEDWSRSGDIYSKDKKESVSQKYSHFCTALEAIFKDFRFKPRRRFGMPEERMKKPEYKYFARPR